MCKHADLNSDMLEKHLQMYLQLSDYLGKSKNLVAHASEG